MSQLHLKWRQTLLEYIKTRLNGEEFIELFSSWAGEEGLERNKKFDCVVCFDDGESIDNFEIKDR